MSNAFSENLKAARREKKLKQWEVAEHIGIARTTYANYEMGKKMPKLDKVHKLAELLSVSTDFLLGPSDQTNSNIMVSQDKITAIPVLSYPQFDLDNIDPESIIDYRYYDRLINIEHDCAIFQLTEGLDRLNLSVGDLALVRFQNTANEGEYVYIVYEDQVILRQLFYTPDAIILGQVDSTDQPLIAFDDDFMNGKVKFVGIVIEWVKRMEIE